MRNLYIYINGNTHNQMNKHGFYSMRTCIPHFCIIVKSITNIG